MEPAFFSFYQSFFLTVKYNVFMAGNRLEGSKKKIKKKTHLISPFKSETFLIVTFVTSCLPSKSVLFSVIGAWGSVN